MNQARDIDLINELIALPAEANWVEFKHNNSNKDMIGKTCSALSNAARIEDKHFAYIIWGIEDQSKDIIGTTFEPSSKLVGNQGFELWLANKLKPSAMFQFRVVEHPKERVVLMEIPAATSAPIQFDGTAYIRIGSTTPKLADHTQRYEALINALRPFAWEHGMAMSYVTGDEVLDLLDYAAYFRLLNMPLPDKSAIFEYLETDQLIVKDVGGKWNITNLGAILIANDIRKFSPSLARKAVRFVAYNGNNRVADVTHRQDGSKGYANGFEGLISFVNGLIPKNEIIEQALRRDNPMFPPLAVRELIANALIHQDMTISGTGPQIELFKDRIEFTNPGTPLVPTDRMIDLPPRSRNEALAAIMRRMGICEEQGSGLDKVIASVEVYQLPPPLFKANDASMQIILYGPRTFANMSPNERVRACYQHSILKLITDTPMTNTSLRERFGIETQNASQASIVLRKALDEGLIKHADPDHPRSGYVPHWS